MDWLAENWFFVVVGILIALLVLRLLFALLPSRRSARHTGEQAVRVIGVGGAGGNAVNQMVAARQPGVEYIALNTDGQVLEESLADRRVQIGDSVTRGLGAGGDAALGRRAAEEDTERIREVLTDADLVFVAAGLGGGTGSGAGPIVAAQARELGALTVAVVTLPFAFEGTTRRAVADAAVEALRPNVDTLLVIENERVTGLVAEDTQLSEAFRVVNEVLGQTIRAVVDIMSMPGLVNLDFADIGAVMRDGGAGLAGIGQASGPNRAEEAARKAIASPLLALELHGARAILLHVAGSSQLTLREVVRAADIVREAADPEANLVFGATFDDQLGDELRVTVIATRFGEEPRTKAEPEAALAPSLAEAGTPASAAEPSTEQTSAPDAEPPDNGIHAGDEAPPAAEPTNGQPPGRTRTLRARGSGKSQPG